MAPLATDRLRTYLFVATMNTDRNIPEFSAKNNACQYVVSVVECHTYIATYHAEDIKHTMLMYGRAAAGEPVAHVCLYHL